MSIRFLARACAGAAVLVSALTSAEAADLGRPAGPAASHWPVPDAGTAPYNWQGLYFGGSVGYGWGDSAHTYDRGTNHGLANNDVGGGIISVNLGYNWQAWPGFIAGVEGDIGTMDLSGDDRTIFDGHRWSTRYGPFWGTLRARAGYTFDRMMIYGTGGLAFMDIDEVAIGDAAGQTAINDDFATGWTVGGGIEYAIAPNMTMKAEYLHMDFGEVEGLSANNERYTFDNTVDVIRAGVNVRF